MIPEDTISQEAVARLRANMAAAGIALSEEDLAKLTTGPYLNHVGWFLQLISRIPVDTVPDNLKDWGEPEQEERGEAR